MGGVFLSFSVAVMPGLGRVPAVQGVAVMRAINQVIVNPVFIPLFVGTGVVGVVAAAVGGSWVLWVGAGLYVVGVWGVTGVRNVPWNRELEALPPGTAEAAEYWVGYLRRWTAWNHVRTAASTGAAVAFVVG
nr:anthrone oxygenase family protein [Actinokineospora inagensis]